jgi:hypothetical protein
LRARESSSSPLRRAPRLVSVIVCDAAASDPNQADCIAQGLPGVRIELLHGGEPTAIKDYYTNEYGIPTADGTESTTNSVAFFYNVPPGDYDVRLFLPPFSADLVLV